MGTTGFALSKWYADCVADDGEVIIAYVAKLAWRGFHLNYASLPHTEPSGKTSSRTAIMNVELPEVADREFYWKSQAFDFSGRWTARQNRIEQTIYESEEGAIRWECLHPLAEASLKLGGREISGLGYVERLDMTLPPWKMPIDRLNWGRFLGGEHSVVWIDWQGEHRTRHVWVDGEARETKVLDESQVILEDGAAIELHHDATLREGVIGETVLNVLPKWLGPLPGRVLGIRETKWRSRGELRLGDESVQGWAIHEVVEWPK